MQVNVPQVPDLRFPAQSHSGVPQRTIGSSQSPVVGEVSTDQEIPAHPQLKATLWPGNVTQ